jgi:hypothetical protein
MKITIQDIFREYGPLYLARFGTRMPASQKKVLRAIQQCRSGAFGTGLYECPSCRTTHHIPCSCGNRHCPMCQQHKADQWRHKQLRRLLPCHYFLITFTVPEEIRPLIRSNQRVGYEALFSASSEALKKLAADTRFVGTSKIGMVGVLHTWGGMLPYHPHVHYIVPGGGISKDGTSWQSARQDLFVHITPLSRIFKAKFRDAMRNAGLYDHIDPSVWKRDWVVDAKAAGDGTQSLAYMARYLFRVAISNARILGVRDRHVVFRYKAEEDGTRTWQTTNLEVFEFMRRFLQHVLPTGFMKVRHYGFLNGNFSLPIEKIRGLVCSFFRILRDSLPAIVSTPAARPRCPRCKTVMKLVLFFPAPRLEVPSG